jgi:hypothetical protein
MTIINDVYDHLLRVYMTIKIFKLPKTLHENLKKHYISNKMYWICAKKNPESSFLSHTGEKKVFFGNIRQLPLFLKINKKLLKKLPQKYFGPI